MDQLAITWCEDCRRQLRSEASQARGRGPKCDAKRHPPRRRVRRRAAQSGPDLFEAMEVSVD